MTCTHLHGHTLGALHQDADVNPHGSNTPQNILLNGDNEKTNDLWTSLCQTGAVKLLGNMGTTDIGGHHNSKAIPLIKLVLVLAFSGIPGFANHNTACNGGSVGHHSGSIYTADTDRMDTGRRSITGRS